MAEDKVKKIRKPTPPSPTMLFENKALVKAERLRKLFDDRPKKDEKNTDKKDS